MRTTHLKTLVLSAITAGGLLMIQSTPSLAADYSAGARLGKKPEITGYRHPGNCVKKGSRFTIVGRYFGSHRGKGIALGGHGIHVDLPVSRWANFRIVATLPNDPRIQGGQWYYTGIEKTNHSAWLSNISKNITVCRSGDTGSGKRLPDLRVRITAPRTAVAGSDIGSQIKVVTYNTGNATAQGTDTAGSNGYMIDVMLSTDTSTPAGYAIYSPNYSEDVLLKGGRISNTKKLTPGSNRPYPTGGGIPADTPTGSYFICAKIDSGNKITESNEGNNVACARIRIRGRGASSGDRPVAVKEDCVGFNPRTTRLRRVGSHWKIADGSHWLHDFGSNRREALKSLSVIKRYRANRHCFVGRPKASLHYILVGGGAPSGSMRGEDCVRFNPATTTVRRINNDWKIVDGNHWMFSFGNKVGEARTALAIIKKYRFARSCYVGRPNPSYTYMRR